METTPDFVLFLGRFHPLVVHLPIGFLLLGFVMELVSRRPKYEALKGATSFVLLLSFAGAILAIVMGLMLSQSGGYDEDLLFWHKAQGIGMAVFTLLAWAVKTQPKVLRLPAVMQKAYMPLLVLAVLSLSVAGHNGGSLTHGEDYLFQYAPNGIRAIAGLPPKKEKRGPITDINEALVFDDLIQPMLEQRCVSCHRAGKKKGELRMDTAEELLKGGEEGPVFVAGNAAESNMIIRVHLPEEDEEHMPPEGKRPLTEKQIQVIEWWIDGGAPMDKKVAEMEVSDEIRPLLAAFQEGGGGLDEDLMTPKGIFAEQVAAADPGAIATLAGEGVLVMPISQETNFLRVTVNQDTTPFADTQMKLLLPLANQITWLDLRYATPKDFSALARLTNLTELHLEHSPIQDADLQHLSGLTKLEYLNLYGTEISNEGLQHLHGLTELRALYLWQSKVDSTGVKELMTVLPETEINLGWPMQTSK